MDTDGMPANRDGIECVNCGKYWFNHHGWACDKPSMINSMIVYRSVLTLDKQYLTKDMAEYKEENNLSPNAGRCKCRTITTNKIGTLFICCDCKNKS